MLTHLVSDYNVDQVRLYIKIPTEFVDGRRGQDCGRRGSRRGGKAVGLNNALG